MQLPREVYKELEDIVEPDNVTEEPAILDSYAFQLNAETSRGGSKFLPRPIATIMPGSTEEVQAIVKTCNRYRIKYKPYGSGWGVQASARTDGVIQMDMRRMDRILEIDEKNMFAVVEPYVVGATLQAEAMKVGLNCHIIGAGASCSILASATSFMGTGPDAIFMGHSAQNLLALEWVMPDGEILRTGSMASGIGWFCGEGPGPSLRGISRGWLGAMGGLGVFTKCTVKLSPWPGPAQMPVQGEVPYYNSPLPANFKAYTVAFPSWQAYAETLYKIYDAEIGYIIHRQFNMWGDDLQAAMLKIQTDPTKSLEDLEELLETPEIKKLTEEMRISFQIILAGNTIGDLKYQEKALNELLSETGGWRVAAMEKPEMERWVLLYLIKLCFKNLNFVYGGGYAGSFSLKGSPDWVTSTLVPVAKETMGAHQKKGLIVKSGSDSMMSSISDIGGGGRTWMEQFSFYDPHDKKSMEGVTAYLSSAVMAGRERGWPPSYDTDYVEPFGPARDLRLSRMAFPHQVSLQWQRKIKEVFDPNDTGEGSYAWSKAPEE
ncbi:FAD-binding oxidoreductase [Chloroflexota bacterium]